MTSGKAIVGLLVIVYIISPVVFKYSIFIQRSLLFMNNVNTQYHVNLSHPERLGLECTRTLRLKNELRATKENEDKPEMGVWHILPSSRRHDCSSSELDRNRRVTLDDEQLAFDDAKHIVLYVHGNGGTRAGEHRVQLYQKLTQKADLHVVTFDYCGYADSTYLTPTADGLSSDALTMYQWLLKQPKVNASRITVWGHSLGTAVAVRMVADLPDQQRPRRLILEAPFDSLANAVANHPFSVPFRVIPYFEYFFVEPIAKSTELNFDSAERIGDIKPPTKLLIMHAEDDAIIPHKLGQSLYKKARSELDRSHVNFISLPESQGLGHKLICLHSDTMNLVEEFIKSDSFSALSDQ